MSPAQKQQSAWSIVWFVFRIYNSTIRKSVQVAGWMSLKYLGENFESHKWCIEIFTRKLQSTKIALLSGCITTNHCRSFADSQSYRKKYYWVRTNNNIALLSSLNNLNNFYIGNRSVFVFFLTYLFPCLQVLDILFLLHLVAGFFAYSVPCLGFL